VCSDGAFAQCVEAIPKDVLQNVMTSLPARKQECTDGDADNVSIIIFKSWRLPRIPFFWDMVLHKFWIVFQQFETIWCPLRCLEMSGSKHLQTQRQVPERQILSSTALKTSKLTIGYF